MYCGTSGGKIVAWKNTLENSSPNSSDQWRNIGNLAVGSMVSSIKVGGCGLIACEYKDSLSLLYQNRLAGVMTSAFKIIQTSSTVLQIYYLDPTGSPKINVFDPNFNLKSFDLLGNKLLIWSGVTATVCDININNPNSMVNDSYSVNISDCKFVALHQDSIIKIDEYYVALVNQEGLVKHEISFPKSEGAIIGFHRNNKMLVCYTNKCYVRMIDISKREIKAVGQTKKIDEALQLEQASIIDLKVSGDSSKLLMIVNYLKTNPQDQNLLVVWNTENDMISKFGLKEELISIAWEVTDSRLFGTLVIRVPETGPQVKQIITFFINEKGVIKKHDTIDDNSSEALFAIQSPNIVSIAFNTNSKQEKINYILREIPMKEFSGVAATDSLSISSIINFNYHLTNGNMEEAYKAIKHINSTEIWKNMAEMSIKMKRIDVAETCFSNMKFARGAKAIREMDQQGADKDAKIASVAVLLNMVEEAETALKEAKKFDQLNLLYQHKNEWEKAIRVAEHEDRINLKNTYFKAGKNYEQHKNYQEAIKYYEMAEVHLEEVPRMLYENEQFPLLLEYAEKVQDKGVFSFVGKVYEKYEEEEESKNFYVKAGDHAALVRLSLQKNDADSAEAICNSSEDSMACFITGKYFEDKGDTAKALAMYRKGKHYLQAVRLAKLGGDDDEIYAAAILAPFYVQAKVAGYFHKKGFMEKAVILYMKGKNYKKALRLAMDNHLTEYTQQITSLVDKEKADPDSMKNLGDMYIDQGNSEKAFSMYVGSGQVDKAIELLEANNIQLSVDAVKKLIPPKGQTEAENNRRDKIITIIAKRLKQQGKYAAAAKLYMEVNLPVKALKSIILSGDTEKVIQFATLAKSPEAYILAANFLQNGDWQSDPNTIKHITNFYTKAKKFDALVTFYQSCAMQEIDEFKNYEKALTALDVAKKYAEKCADNGKLASLEERMNLIQSFLEGRSMLATQSEEGVQKIKSVIRDRNSRDYLRLGDVYNTLFTHFCSKGDWERAAETMDDMSLANYPPQKHLDQNLLARVEKETGKKAQGGGGFTPWGGNKGNDNHGEDMEEDIIDDIN